MRTAKPSSSRSRKRLDDRECGQIGPPSFPRLGFALPVPAGRSQARRSVQPEIGATECNMSCIAPSDKANLGCRESI